MRRVSNLDGVSRSFWYAVVKEAQTKSRTQCLRSSMSSTGTLFCKRWCLDIADVELKKGQYQRRGCEIAGMGHVSARLAGHILRRREESGIGSGYCLISISLISKTVIWRLQRAFHFTILLSVTCLVLPVHTHDTPAKPFTDDCKSILTPAQRV